MNTFTPPPTFTGGGGCVAPAGGCDGGATWSSSNTFAPPPKVGIKRPASQALDGNSESWSAESGSLASLRMQIKEMQRSDPAGKEQWIAYCDTFGGGKCDPNKHDESFISSFLSQYASGARLESGNDAILTVTKMLQRRSTNLRAVWASYCALNGGGFNDPMKQPSDFHFQFYDFVCSQVMEDGGIGGMGGGGMGGSMGGGMGCAMGGMGGGMVGGMGGGMGGGKGGGGGCSFQPPAAAAVPIAMDAEKAAYVSRIKAYQKADPQQKEAWHDFCNTLGDVTHTKNPTKDPARHEKENLLMFIQRYGVP